MSKCMFQIIHGNSLDEVKNIKTEINCVVTSPPFFKKREYGNSPVEIGKQSEIDDFLNLLVDLFNCIPLHPLGSLWVNLGDKRDKDGSLVMVAERFSIKMKSSGWHLVDNVVWAKIFDDVDGGTEGGCMIEPANGRLNGNGFENFYRFVKSDKANKAWADTCAVRIPRQEKGETVVKRYLPEHLMSTVTSIEGRNLHNVWRIPMGQSKDKHYAVFPEALCERPIAMTCPMRICKICGHIRTRIVEMEEYDEQRGNKRIFGKYSSTTEKDIKQKAGRQDIGKQYVPKKPVTKGWTECEHKDWKSGVVLDPFSGSGTTGKVALKMGRSFIGIDLYEEFVNMSRENCQKTINYMKENNYDAWLCER